MNTIDSMPPPSSAALELSLELSNLIKIQIDSFGPLNFANYMKMALYTPRLGYYSNGLTKFGAEGDFITAPEISPLFSYCIANQIKQVIQELPTSAILEFGAGTGRMAGDILEALEQQHSLPDHYYILELSATLRARQEDHLKQLVPQLFDRIIWLDQLPNSFQGIIIANEVMDAMPVQQFIWEDDQLKEYSIDWNGQGFIECTSEPSAELLTQVKQLNIDFEEGYRSEINLALPAWIGELAKILQRGLILLMDYGYPRREYYHPDRRMGTLRCHYQHRAHDNPLLWPGLQDITAHVDFTAIAEAAIKQELSVGGYTTQAHFLIGCGLMEMAANMHQDVIEQYQTSQQIKRLILPSEMGELVKVIGLTKGLDCPLIGFEFNDLSAKL